MNGSEWLASLPEQPTPVRDQMILEAVTSGLATCEWVPVTSKNNNYTAIFYVCDDAVSVTLDDGSRFRFPVSAKLAQQCADSMQASLPTSKVCDLAYQQATVKLPATLLPAGADMVTTTKSKTWNAALEKKRQGQTGLIRDCGKAWILSNARGAGAVNYGFYDPHAPYSNVRGLKLWQNVGTRHNALHTDYSQTLILMKLECEINGQTLSVLDVMKHPMLSKLINDDGVLASTRQV
jgi:hypothetical protein